MLIRRMMVLLCCLLLLQSCTTDITHAEYTVIHYPSEQNVRELFFERKVEFERISHMLYDKNDFFFENDNSLQPGLSSNDAGHFTQEEWQSIQIFMKETGLVGISWHPFYVHQGCEDERTGILLEYYFAVDEKTNCILSSLSAPEDEELEQMRLYLYYDQMNETLDMEREELGEGWHFFILHHDH